MTKQRLNKAGKETQAPMSIDTANGMSFSPSEGSFEKRMALLIEVLRGQSALLLLIGMITAASLLSDVFLTPRNIVNIIRAVSVIGIVSLGQTLLIITCNFDMSVSSVVAFSGILAVGTQSLGLVPSVIIGLLGGILVGFINGIIVSKTKANSFLITLGMQIFVYSISLIFTRARTLYGKIPAFNVLGRGDLWGFLPISVIIFLSLALIFKFVLKWCIYGRNLYAIGGNEEACRLAGISTDILKIVTFTICGFTAALAGVILTSRLNSTTANAGFGMEFESIIAVVLGGTNLFGGSGGTLKTIWGVLILGVLTNLLILMNVPYEGQIIIKALLFLGVVSINILTRKQ